MLQRLYAQFCDISNVCSVHEDGGGWSAGDLPSVSLSGTMANVACAAHISSSTCGKDDVCTLKRELRALKSNDALRLRVAGALGSMRATHARAAGCGTARRTATSSTASSAPRASSGAAQHCRAQHCDAPTPDSRAIHGASHATPKKRSAGHKCHTDKQLWCTTGRVP